MAVVPVNTPDYLGCLESGYALALEALLRTLVPASDCVGRRPRQVNVLASAMLVLRDPRGWRGYALGVALGFLPCGLLYGALAAAAGAGGPARGALAMAAFTLGTAPALIGVGWVGAFFARRFLPALRAIAAPVMVLNAAVLLVLAWRALG